MALEREFCKWSFCAKPEVVNVETDLLLVGGGMACTGAAVEAAAWAKAAGLKVTLVDKAALDRSGAVAMGCGRIRILDDGPSRRSMPWLPYSVSRVLPSCALPCKRAPPARYRRAGNKPTSRPPGQV